jgi:hypothetical protein
MGGEGAQRPVWHVNEPKKDGCAQRKGAHARPKPTSLEIGKNVTAAVKKALKGLNASRR